MIPVVPAGIVIIFTFFLFSFTLLNILSFSPVQESKHKIELLSMFCRKIFSNHLSANSDVNFPDLDAYVTMLGALYKFFATLGPNTLFFFL